MKISIIAVGKLKENYFKDAVSEYLKRLSAFASVEIIEIPEDKKDLIHKEGIKIISQIPKNAFVYSLAISGKKLSSQNFSKEIEKNAINGYGHLVFIIGGSLGLSDEVLQKSDFRLSFSDMTFPHQLMRVILLEQIYRCFKIIENAPYHK
jgi:23S rRNA (pseudouridine1915-N3)-methyltransferase